MALPARSSSPSDHTKRLAAERLRQLRGLLLLALIVIAFAAWRAGAARVFTPGWWRPW